MPENQNLSVNSVIENLISIHPLLTKTFTRSIRSKTNHNPGTLYVLGILARYNILSMSEIGCKLSMPKPHVTGLVDKLIAEKLVERLNDPNDRRIINIRITKKGATDFNKLKMEISEEFRLKLKLLSEDQLAELMNASTKVKNILISILVDKTE